MVRLQTTVFESAGSRITVKFPFPFLGFLDDFISFDPRWIQSGLLCNIKVKQTHYRPGQALRVREFEAPRFQDNRHMKVVRLSALGNGRLYSQETIPGTFFCYRLSQSQGHSAAGRLMSMKKSNDVLCNIQKQNVIRINQPTRCINLSDLLLVAQIQLNMFRASSCPSPGAYKLQ